MWLCRNDYHWPSQIFPSISSTNPYTGETNSKGARAGGLGATLDELTYRVLTDLLKEIQVLLGAAEIFPDVEEAEGLLLAGADPVLVFPWLREAIQKDPVGFPHCLLAYWKAACFRRCHTLRRCPCPTPDTVLNMERSVMADVDTLAHSP